MAFERDPAVVLQNEILKTKEARLKIINTKKSRFKLQEDYFIYENPDQEFINDYISASEFFPECD